MHFRSGAPPTDNVRNPVWYSFSQRRIGPPGRRPAGMLCSVMMCRRFSLRSTAGSLRGSTRSIWKRRRRCFVNWPL